MNKLFLVLALLFALSACSVGKKCTYTQDGTKISSWVWFYGDKPIDQIKITATKKMVNFPHDIQIMGMFIFITLYLVIMIIF